MPSALAGRRAAARLLRPLAVAAAALPLALASPAPAQAGAPAEGAVVGKLVQAYPESAHEAGSLAASPLTWVRPASGPAVRVATGDVGGIAPGSTVRVSVGGRVRDAATADGFAAARSVTAASVLAAPDDVPVDGLTPISDTLPTPTDDDGTADSGTADQASQDTGDATSGDAASGGSTTDGSTTDGSTTDGSSPDGSTTDGSSPDGSTTDGSSPDGSTAPGSGTVRIPAAPDVTDRVTVVLAEVGGVRADAPADDTTVQSLVDAVDGPVHDFWSQQTGGVIRLGVTAAHDWLTTTAGCDDPIALWDEVAAKAHFTSGPRNHLLVYVGSASADVAHCSYGLAEVGSGVGSGGRLYVSDVLPSLIAHELGHNFGLGHSSGRQCAAAVDAGRCRTAGYRDFYDVMGASWEEVGTLNAAQEARLGVLPAAQRRTVSASDPGGSVTLAPLSGRSGVRALELTAADGTDYWLEYRSATGQDAWLGTAADRLGLQPGVLLHRAGGLPDTSLLLDGTPSPASKWDADVDMALPVGVQVRLSHGFAVTVRSVTAGGARLTFTTPGPAAPTASAVAPAPQSTRVLPGGGCTTACGDRSSGDAATAPQQHDAQPVGPLAVPPATVPLHATAQDEAAPMALASQQSPTMLAALCAIGCAGMVLTWFTVQRVRGGSRRRTR